MKEINVSNQSELDVAWRDPNVDVIKLEGDADVLLAGDLGNPEFTIRLDGLVSAMIRDTDDAVIVEAYGESTVDVVNAPNVTVKYYQTTSGCVYGASYVYADEESEPYVEKAGRVSAYGKSNVRVFDVENVEAHNKSEISLFGDHDTLVSAFNSSSVRVSDESHATIRLYGQAFAEVGQRANNVKLFAYDESISVVRSGSVYATEDATVSVIGGSPTVRGSGMARIRRFAVADEADIKTFGQSFVSMVLSTRPQFDSVEDWANCVGADYRPSTRMLWGYVAAMLDTDRASTNHDVDMTKPQPFLDLDESTHPVSVFAHAADAAKDPNRVVYRVAVPVFAVESIQNKVVWASDFFVQGKVEF